MNTESLKMGNGSRDFVVDKSQWGTYTSYDNEGKAMITALSEDLCRQHTIFYMDGVASGWSNCEAKPHEGTVGGKL